MRAASSSQYAQRAGTTYDVIPMTGLATLEKSLALPARHDLVEESLLGPSVVQVVLDDIAPERGASDRPRLQGGNGIAQRRREPLGIALVGVPFERGRRLESLLDPVEPGCDQRR